MNNNDKKTPQKKHKTFKFKQFSVSTPQIGMPVSTDGVMLGAWFDGVHIQSLLDIGTGSGLLTLMAAQNSAETQIFAIDMDKNAYDTAIKNQLASPWANRFTTLHGDVLTTPFPQLFDAIICNPPYFVNGPLSHSPLRAMARHSDTLQHDALLQRCWQLLTANGKASFILPKVEGEAFIATAKQQGWHLARLCQVQPTQKKPVHRLLFELRKSATQLQQTKLIIHANNGYSDDFIALTKDFYLKM